MKVCSQLVAEFQHGTGDYLPGEIFVTSSPLLFMSKWFGVTS